MSNEEVDIADNEDDFTDDNEDLWLDQRELILLVKSNPALYAKSSKEYSGKGFDKDLTWQRIGLSLSKPLSGPEASKLFYNIRQRFGRERRKVAASLKGKSGQGTMAHYVPTWPLYEDCLFLADHIVARKTSSNYNTLPIQKAAAVTNFRAGGAASTFTLPPPSPPVFRSTVARPSPSPSPPVFRSTVARPSPSPSPPVFRSHLSSSEDSGSLSAWSSANDLFQSTDNSFVIIGLDYTDRLVHVPNDESDTSDSRSSTGRSCITEEALISPGVNQSSQSDFVQAIREAGFKSKRTVPVPDNFAVKKKKDDDLLSQAIIHQTKQLCSMTAKLNSNSILDAISIDKVILQSVPVERHLECIMEVLSIITEKYVKGRQE